MKDIRKGLAGLKEMVVGPHDLASFTGNIGAEVLSTHRVVLLMEQACREAVRGRLDEGRMTVGTMIEMRHRAATPQGARVRAESVLEEFDGRRLVFEIRVFDEFEEVARGRNERFIVSEENFAKNVSRKKARSRGQGA